MSIDERLLGDRQLRSPEEVFGTQSTIVLDICRMKWLKSMDGPCCEYEEDLAPNKDALGLTGSKVG